MGEKTPYIKSDRKANDTIEIDLKDVFFALWRNLIVIAGVAAIAALVVFGYSSFFIEPAYETQASIMVVNKQEETALSSSDLTIATTLSSDYTEIVKSDSVLDKVSSILNLGLTAEELSKSVSVENASGTRIITITVTNNDPFKAKLIADSLAECSAQKISEVMDVGNIARIVDTAKVPDTKASPSPVKNAVIAFIVVLIILWFIYAVIFISDDKIKSSGDLESRFAVPVLAVIPLNTSSNNAVRREPDSAAGGERMARHQGSGRVGDVKRSESPAKVKREDLPAGRPEENKNSEQIKDQTEPQAKRPTENSGKIIQRKTDSQI